MKQFLGYSASEILDAIAKHYNYDKCVIGLASPYRGFIAFKTKQSVSYVGEVNAGCIHIDFPLRICRKIKQEIDIAKSTMQYANYENWSSGLVMQMKDVCLQKLLALTKDKGYAFTGFDLCRHERTVFLSSSHSLERLVIQLELEGFLERNNCDD